jgi:hypothetical protein
MSLPQKSKYFSSSCFERLADRGYLQRVMHTVGRMYDTCLETFPLHLASWGAIPFFSSSRLYCESLWQFYSLHDTNHFSLGDSGVLVLKWPWIVTPAQFSPATDEFESHLSKSMPTARWRGSPGLSYRLVQYPFSFSS